ncbi:TlpA disulfide reductase family protein [Gaoshiqia sediminis]|uniref:AhpC/TSA family protein n=1 Tax=Gaoshiqia sediminis TaxID=2986998 RepID=A0AA41YAX9_9BACT|nr:TlpA disulfide reductase family protein [Gaoshiqia sediminis]MCW0482575.1 AhpC/TSA family protein [Gaoshiqia sediminis]
MVRKIVFLLVVAAVAVSCSDPSQYSIQGRISNAENRYVYLDELKVSSTVNIDSVLVGKDGGFRFKGNVSYPTFFLLKLNEKNFVTLLVDSAEQVEVYGDAANFSRDYRVTGSEGSAMVQELNRQLSRTKHELDSIRSLMVSFRNEMNYADRKQKWDEEYNRIREAQIQYSQKFVATHPFSMANVLALYQKFDDDTYVIQDLQSLKVAASALNSFYPESEHVKALYANTMKLMQDERNARMQQFIQEAGQNSPDILLPNADGKEVALSSLQGKYVLLQFWSAADRGSRIMNPVLVELYKKYRAKGFEIYQVSIDENRYEWLDAIDEDGLNWINVGDMKGSVSAVRAYNIQAVPSNYLLDKEGAIVGKDLKGPGLDRLLGEVLR